MAKVTNKLQEILSEEVPLCTGVIPLEANNSQLFYRNAADGSLGYHTLLDLFFHKDVITLFVS